LQAFNRQRQMRTTFRACNGMYFVEDQRADALQVLARARGEEQIQRLRRRDQNVGRIAKHRRALFLRRVTGANTDPQFGLQPGQRAAQVALDVVVQGLERGHIDQPQTLARLGVEPVDAVEEGGERLAGARGRLDQRVPAVRNRRPTEHLGGSRRAESILEPGSRPGAENGERVHLPRVLARGRSEAEDRLVWAP
jgi:hypothetical protein